LAFLRVALSVCPLHSASSIELMRGVVVPIDRSSHIILLAFLAVLEWIAALHHAPRQPWVYTFMAVLAGAAFA
jgi:hypothetical protein